MKQHYVILFGLLNALGAGVYIALVALFLWNAEGLFGKVQNFWGPVFFLLLFVISAAITGGLVLGKPILLYFDGKKREGIELFVWPLIFLALVAIVALLILLVHAPITFP